MKLILLYRKLVKDLRTGHKETDTTAVLDGEIDIFIREMLKLKLSGKGFQVIEDCD